MHTIIFLALLGCALAAPRSIHRIVGGSATTIETYPYMSNMQLKFYGIWWRHSCGGSLLTSTAVLSAAHCFYADLDYDHRVVLGSSLSHSGGSVHNVRQIIMHPEYIHDTLDNDVAIVRLNNPAVFSSRVQVARIPGPNYIIADGANVTYIGWGRLHADDPRPSEELMHVDVNIINQQLCAERYDYLKTQPWYEQHLPVVTSGMLCAGILDQGGKDSCTGDSGGPLAHFGDIVVGVTSWNYDCGDAFYPSVTARVSHFSNWIVANAN